MFPSHGGPILGQARAVACLEYAALRLAVCVGLGEGDLDCFDTLLRCDQVIVFQAFLPGLLSLVPL